MITIFKNQANTVVLTLTELSTIDNPNYLLRFEDKEKNAYSYCLLGTDLSASTERCNEFVITDKVGPNPLVSEVNLSPGQYYYTAYQLTDEQVEDIDLDNIDVTQYVRVEGPCQMITHDPEEVNTFYEGPKENTVYEQG